MHVNGLKLNGPLTKPLKSDRAVGDVNIGDLPLRDLFETSGKLEQFVDVNLNVALDPRETFWDNVIYKLCAQGKYAELPPPFCLKSEPKCPFSMQIIVIPSTIPPDQDHKYVNIVKHIYLHKNKLWSKDCMSFCQGSSALRAKLRSAQWCYWHRNDDLWLQTGVMCTWAMSPFLA